MKNKVQVSAYSVKHFLLIFLLLAFSFQTPASATASSINIQPNSELKVRQRGSNLEFRFPRTQHRSALKLLNINGNLTKAVMVDEGVETINLPSSHLPKGIYQCVLENRAQRFTVKLLLQ